MVHEGINHQEQFADGDVPTNPLEGFWALIKRAWYGRPHHSSTTSMPLSIVETAWKYTEPKTPNAFESVLRGCMG